MNYTLIMLFWGPFAGMTTTINFEYKSLCEKAKQAIVSQTREIDNKVLICIKTTKGAENE